MKRKVFFRLTNYPIHMQIQFPCPSFVLSPALGLYFLLISASSLLVWHFIKRRRNDADIRKRYRFPPGPRPWPIIGNSLQIDLCNPHKSFIQWAKQFGPIYTVYLPKPQVVIAGAKELNELLNGPKYANIFADRPTFSFLYGIFCHHQPDGNGIILSRQGVWQKNRRFALSAFRNLGMGRPRMESRIRLQKDELIKRLGDLATRHNGVVNDFQSQLAFCYGNIIQGLVMGRHYEQYNDPEFIFFKNFIESTTREIASLQMLLVDRWPLLRFFFPAYWRYIRDGFALQRFLFREIETHIGHLRAAHEKDEHPEEPESFIDAYLLAAEAEGQSMDDADLKLNVLICAGDLWAGGLETVVTTTTWAALYMLHYPDVQKKIQAEIDEHFNGRPFDLSERNGLHYFRAVIDELQRIVNVLPWNVPHSTSQDVHFAGWNLPKDTIIQAQLGAVHMDPSLFPDPDVFRPERFLDDEGHYKGSDLLKPFGLGKRSCLGEWLVRIELPIVLASLVQNFSFEPVEGENIPSLGRNPGIVSKPDPFKFNIRLRQEELILG